MNTNVQATPFCVASLLPTALAMVPTVQDFDPTVEKLKFKRPNSDAPAEIFLHDLLDGDGVNVEVNGQLMVTLLGCTADEFPEDCLTFEIVN